MSNPDLSGQYWQDQDDAGYGSGWRTGAGLPGREQTPWDDDAGLWRDDRSAGRQEPGSRQQASRYRHGASAGRGSRHEPLDDDRAPGRASGRYAGGARRAAGAGRGDWAARLSQSAGDLRNRLGMGSRAAGRADYGPGDYGTGEYGRADYGPGDYGTGEYGPGDNGTGRAGGRTALRDPADGFRAEPDLAGAGQRSQITGRSFGRGGRDGSGGGDGFGGGGRGGGSRGPDPRNRLERFADWLLYGRWWRHWTWKKALAVCGAAVAAMIALPVLAFLILYATTPLPTAENALLRGATSTVYFSNRTLLGTFTNGGFSHQILTTQQIPKIMDEAIVAAEDRHFYTEGGISFTGTIRAALNDLFGSGNLQGASTITEQFAKNYYQSLSNIAASQSITYKIDEVIAAMKIARTKSKSWVLTQYLNTAPFGPTTYGVGAGALQYFNINLTKPGANLSVARAAMLAAMPNSPSGQSPYPSSGLAFENLVYRWQYVLHYMVIDGAITQAQANSLCVNCALPQAEKVFTRAVQPVPPGSTNGWNGYDGYLMEMVQQELHGTYHLTASQIDTGGYRIITTFKPSMVNALARAVNTEKRRMRAAGVPLPKYDFIGATLIDPQTGAIDAIYGGPGYGASNCNGVCDLDMAESPHPVGSSFKPYVLATAVNEGMNVSTSVLNGYSPLWIPPQTEPMKLSQRNQPANTFGWWESNTELPGGGPISVPDAAAVSSDPAFGDLVHRVGVYNVINMAQAFGVGSTPLTYQTPVLTANGTEKYVNNDLVAMQDTFGPNGSDAGAVNITYGQSPVTAVEQASMMATLADDGVFHTPHVIARLTRGSTTIPLRVTIRRVLSPAAAADEDYALSFDNQPTYPGATAWPNAAWNRPVIGKTGTLGIGNTVQDAWFIGAIPQYSLAVGLFTNSSSENLNNLASTLGMGGAFGGAWPAATWDQFMTTEFGSLPVQHFATPNYVGFTKWVQVAAQTPHKQACQQGPGPFGHKCKNCPPGHSHQCGNPQPSPSCQGSGFGQCTGSPSPTPTCPGSGGPSCGSPSPSPTPSASCTSAPPGPPCGQGATTASYLFGPATARSSPGRAAAPAPSMVLTAAEAADIRVAAVLGLVT